MSPLVSTRFLQTQPDARLVALARAGYERAFEALVNRYRRQLLAYCRRLTESEGSAEDVLQQALLQAWVAIQGDAEVREIRAWLYRIVHNVAVSSMRRPGAEIVELHGGERAAGADVGGTHGADREVEQRLAARQALEGLAALPELQREVMLGTAVQGRSHEELAASLGLSNGAVRGLIYRARATLRAAAAAIIPGPLVNWAAHQHGAGAGRVSEAIAGSGSAGLGALLLKGGAVVATAGALATAAGVASPGPSHRAHHPARAPLRLAARAAAPAHGQTVLVSDRVRTRSEAARTAGGSRRGQARHRSPGSNGGSREHSGPSEHAGAPGASSRGPGGAGSGSESSGSGPGSGGSNGGSNGGSDGGSDRGGSGSSGGSDGGTSNGGGSRSGSGSGSGGSDGGSGPDGGSNSGGSGGSGSGSGSGSGGSTLGGSTSASSGSDAGVSKDGGSDGRSTSGSGSTSGGGSGSSDGGSGSSDGGSGPSGGH